MNYRLLILIVSISFGLCCPLHAQEKDLNPVLFPNIRHLYQGDSGKESNIDRFFTDWENWSTLIAKGSAPSEYNEIYKKHFLENYRQDSPVRYITLPFLVKVIKYDCDIRPTPEEIDSEDADSDDVIIVYEDSGYLKETPESISFFTPVIEADKKVLYLLPEAERILSSFLDEPRNDNEDDRIREEVQTRMHLLREYVPTVRSHWGTKWCFTTYPLIDRMVVGNDGYYIFLSANDYSGDDYFVPWGEEPIDLGSWIQ